MKRFATCLFVALLLGSCAKTQGKSEASPPPVIAATAPRRSVNGVIKEIPGSRAYLLIKHEDIPGYMKAMTMEFELLRPAQADGLAVGDAITFTFVESEDQRLVIEAVKKR